MRLVVLESPFAGDVEANLTYARAAMVDCLFRGEAPFASHLLYTQVLSDEIPEDRERGMLAGWGWMIWADACVVYYDRGISIGMQEGIDRARSAGLDVEYRQILSSPSS